MDRVGPGAASNTLPPPVRDAAVINRFESAWRGAFERLSSAPAVPTRRIVTFDLSRAASAVLTSTDPAVTFPKRLATMLTVGGRSMLSGVDDRLVVSGLADRVLAFPDLPVPAYELLARLNRERFLPGLEAIPPNAVTLLETNPRFVEAFLVGMNHEMNGELLWREYPTDRRGTPLRRFWDWHDDGPDIEPIHTWRETSELGTNTRGGVGGQIVLLVRGDLLRRYPNTSVLAWRADGRELKNPPGDGDIVNHVFAGRIDPDVSFYGFPLTDDDLEDDGWFFVLQEQPTEPRFGFDEAAAAGATPPLTTWSDASWAHAGTAPGGHLRLAGHPLSGTTRNGATFAAHSGHLAAITLQRPIRVAVRSGRLVDL